MNQRTLARMSRAVPMLVLTEQDMRMMYVNCPNCGGSGKTEDSCSGCGGSGYRPGNVKCYTCRGLGRIAINCWRCRGTGKIDK